MSAPKRSVVTLGPDKSLQVAQQHSAPNQVWLYKAVTSYVSLCVAPTAVSSTGPTEPSTLAGG